MYVNYLIVAGLSAVVFWWFLRGSKKPPKSSSDGTRILYFGSRPKSFAILMTFLIDAIIAWVWINDTKTSISPVWIVLALVVFAIPGVYLVLLFFGLTVSVSHERVAEVVFGKPRVSIQWISVKRVELSSYAIILHGFDDKKISVSLFMHGTREFLNELERRLPKWVHQESRSAFAQIHRELG